ncbi:MAG: hypothetical protein QOF58_4002 [Pseudonocardiales bacterium]|jgi:hypothetical protein|nr:hypothetical protein [Pseudonocardiales bacterium]
MTTATIELSDIVSFVLERATTDNLDNIAGAIKSRRGILAEIAAANLDEGTPVTLYNLRPKYLTGLTGTVKKIFRGRGEPHATVTLDKDSTAMLAYASTKYVSLAGRDSYDCQGIPLSCLKVAGS